jgi:hypothetical protein
MGLLDEVSYAPSLLMADSFPITSQYRPDLPSALRQNFNRAKDFGPRWNENANSNPMTSLKGYGWLGLMPTQSGGVMSEFSGSAPIDRKKPEKGWMNFPHVVPSLNRSEVDYLLTEPKGLAAIPTNNRAIDDSVYQKALQWAQMRRLQGLDPFID